MYHVENIIFSLHVKDVKAILISFARDIYNTIEMWYCVL